MKSAAKNAETSNERTPTEETPGYTSNDSGFASDEEYSEYGTTPDHDGRKEVSNLNAHDITPWRYSQHSTISGASTTPEEYNNYGITPGSISPPTSRHVRFNSRIHLYRPHTASSAASSISGSLRSTSSVVSPYNTNRRHSLMPIMQIKQARINERSRLMDGDNITKNDDIDVLYGRFPKRLLNWEYIRWILCGNCCDSLNYNDEDDV